MSALDHVLKNRVVGRSCRELLWRDDSNSRHRGVRQLHDVQIGPAAPPRQHVRHFQQVPTAGQVLLVEVILLEPVAPPVDAQRPVTSAARTQQKLSQCLVVGTQLEVAPVQVVVPLHCPQARQHLLGPLVGSIALLGLRQQAGGKGDWPFDAVLNLGQLGAE